MGRQAWIVLVLREASCEVIFRELSQHFKPGLLVKFFKLNELAST